MTFQVTSVCRRQIFKCPIEGILPQNSELFEFSILPRPEDKAVVTVWIEVRGFFAPHPSMDLLVLLQ
jgi:hypothetical protein